jgi:hypothetical protein
LSSLTGALVVAGWDSGNQKGRGVRPRPSRCRSDL